MRILIAAVLAAAAIGQEPVPDLEEGEAIVRFLHHSAVTVRTRRHLLIFDYTGPGPGGRARKDGLIDPKQFKDRSVTVFVTHAHQDHWDPGVKAWAAPDRKVRFVVSSDVGWEGAENVTTMSPDEKAELDGPSPLRIRTSGSTDAGVAFWVETDGVAILHTGDLALWAWKATGADAAKKAYLDEIGKFAALKRRLDVAFLCADLRLPGPGRLSGAPLAVEALRPRLALAIHNDQGTPGHAEAASALAAAVRRVPECRVAPVRRRDDEFFLAPERSFDLLTRTREHAGSTRIHLSAEGRVTVRTMQLSAPAGRRPSERRVVFQAPPEITRRAHAWLKGNDPGKIDVAGMRAPGKTPGDPLDSLEVIRAGAEPLPLGRDGAIHPAAQELWDLLEPLLAAAAPLPPEYDGDHQPDWAPR